MHQLEGHLKESLNSVQIPNDPMGRSHEIKWTVPNTNGKGNRVRILKLAVTECIYEIWRLRNDLCFGNEVLNKDIEGKS